MNISLRRAAVLQKNIQDLIKSISLDHTIQLNEFQDAEIQLARAKQEFETNIQRREKLVMALYEIRRSVGDANSSAGVDRLLTDIALLDKQIEFYNGLALQTPRVDGEVVRGQLEKLRSDKGERARLYEPKVESTIFLREDLQGFRKRVAQNRRAKQSLQDRVLELNVETKITLSKETELALSSENLL